MSTDLYQEVTNTIIAMLEQGVAPWRSPILGRSSAGHPANLESRKPYRGVNVFLLAFTAWARGYESAYWLTFNQARSRGGMVKKGEKSSLIVFWKQLQVEHSQTKELKLVPMLRHYRVFNVVQCEGIEVPDVPVIESAPFDPIDAARAIAAGYSGGPAIEHGGSRAFYRPLSDMVRLPEPSRFISSEEYYSTLFHELAHSTGHSSRLDRGLDTELRPFGSADYGREELIAEMAAAFLCGHVGIHPATIENQAAYLQGWLKTIKSDKRMVVAAAGAAQKAADWIRGERLSIQIVD